MSTSATNIPNRAGVGLKAPHYRSILADRPDVGWFEVHPENFMGAGGPPLKVLEAIRRDYPLSLHGVGLSIGADGPLDEDHLKRLKAVNDRFQPGLVSEHLAWSTHGGVFLNDLLPVPYTVEALQRVTEHIMRLQDVLGRVVALENPATYVAFESSEMSEIKFLEAVVAKTGCRLLLDVNNVFVSAANHGYSAEAYIDVFPVANVSEIHLAGHARDTDEQGCPILIDSHDRRVAPAVWTLFSRARSRTGPKPTLIEWDNDVPPWETLIAEAKIADRLLTGGTGSDLQPSGSVRGTTVEDDHVGAR